MDEKRMLQTIEKLEKEIADLKGSKLRNRFRNFFSKSFTKVHWIIGIVIVLVASSLIVYATQITFTDGTVISASEVNSNFTELYDKTSNYSVNVYSAGEWIDDDKATEVTFDSERFDNGGLHDTITNPKRLTAPADGLYLITARLTYNIGTGIKSMSLKLNGTTQFAYYVLESGRSMTVSSIYQLSANDYVIVETTQKSGGQNWLIPDEFSMARLASD